MKEIQRDYIVDAMPCTDMDYPVLSGGSIFTAWALVQPAIMADAAKTAGRTLARVVMTPIPRAPRGSLLWWAMGLGAWLILGLFVASLAGMMAGQFYHAFWFMTAWHEPTSVGVSIPDSGPVQWFFRIPRR